MTRRGRPPKSPDLEDRILDLLTEWHPQHLTAFELELMLSGRVTAPMVRRAIRTLHTAKLITIEPHAHHRHASGRPSHRITLNLEEDPTP